MRITIIRKGSVFAMLALLAACNSVLGIDEAGSISADQDLSDGQEERSASNDLLRSLTTSDDAGDGSTSAAKAAAKSKGDSGLRCASQEKACFDKCVAIDDPRFGCSATSCAPCAIAHASRTTCAEGVCAVLECNEQWADCNQEPSDGCETDLFSSSKSCGACDNACPAGARFCIQGTCGPTAP